MNTINRKIGIVSHDLEHKHIVFIDEDANVLSNFKIDRALDIQKLDNGNFLTQQALEVTEFDNCANIVWQYVIGDTSQKSLEQYAHEGYELCGAYRLDNGNTIIGDLRDSSFYELTPDFKKVCKIKYPYKTLGNLHFLWRMFRVLENGNLLIAGYEHGKIIELDRSGNIVREIVTSGNPYEAIMLDNGNILASLGPSGKIAQYDINGRVLWELDTAKLWNPKNSPWISGICKVGNNIIFADFTNDAIIELDKNLNIVGKLIEPQIFKCPASIVIL